MTLVEHHMAKELMHCHPQAKCPRLANRLWIVWHAMLGRTEPEITVLPGVSRRSIQGWLRRYNLECLQEPSGRERKPHLTAEERQLVAESVAAGLGPDEVCSLRGVESHHFIQARFDNRMSISAVYNVLQDPGYSCLVPRPRHRKSDPVAI